MNPTSKRNTHNRSLSLEIANDGLSFISHSNFSGLSSNLNTKSQKNLSHKRVNSQEIISKVLEEHLLNSNNPSPRTLKPQKSYKSLSGRNSVVRSRRNSKVGKDKLAIFGSEGEIEVDKSLNKAIRAAYDKQAQKEKDFSLKKESLEAELAGISVQIDVLKNRIITQRENLNNRQANLVTLMKDAQRSIRADTSVLEADSFDDVALIPEMMDSDLEVEKKELIKGLLKINKNLSNDLRLLNELSIKGPEQVEITAFRSLVDNSEKSLQVLVDERNLLVHKIYDAEEKLIQSRENKNMIAEDFASQVVAMTECVVRQEETEGLLEELRAKYPASYQLVLEEVRINDRLIDIGMEIKRKDEIAKGLALELSEEQRKLQALSDDAEKLMKELESIQEVENQLRKDILCPQLSIFDKLKEAVKLLPVGKSDILGKLIDFFKIFDVRNKVELSDRYEELLIQYQSMIIDECILVHQNKQDIENLETTVIKLHSKSLENPVLRYDSNLAMRSLQDEIVNKKILMTEKAVQIEMYKKNVYDQLMQHPQLRPFVQTSSGNSFLELTKKMTVTSTEWESVKKLDQIILILANSARDNYTNYFKLNEELKVKTDELYTLGKAISEVKLVQDQKLMDINKNNAQCLENKAEEEALKQEISDLQQNFHENIIKDTEKAYNSYLNEKGKSLRKMKFQYGKNFVDKISTKMIHEYIELETSNLAKLRVEILRAYTTLRGIEEYRSRSTYKIEYELKKNFQKAKSDLAIYSSKLEVLNKELFDLLQKEQIYTKQTERLQSPNTSLLGPQNIYSTLILYKSTISSLLYKLIEGVIKRRNERNRLPSQKAQIQFAIKKIQDELSTVCDSEYKAYEELEKELRSKESLYKEKIEFLEHCKHQLEKTKELCEVTSQIMHGSGNKESFFQSTSTPVAVDKKKLYSSKSSIKLGTGQKENIKVSKLFLDLSKGIVSGTNTPKILNETQNLLNAIDISTSCRSLTKTHSTMHFTSQSHTQLQSNNSDRSNTLHVADMLKNQKTQQTTQPKPHEKVPKYFLLSREKFQKLKEELESGLPIMKKFTTNSSYIGPNSALGVKPKAQEKDLKRYAKRTIRINMQKKAIEIVKVATLGQRTIPEYTYEWKNLMKLGIPAKTLEVIKKGGQENSDEFLPFSIDIYKNGRIDFLSQNSDHIVFLWNIVHQLSSHYSSSSKEN